MDHENKWGKGIPTYNKEDIMEKDDFYMMGLQIIYDILKRDEYEILSINKNINMHPNFVCKKDDTLFFVEVESDGYPNEPTLSSTLARDLIKHAEKFDAICLYAACTFASTDVDRFEAKLNLKYDEYYCQFKGFEIITNKDNVRFYENGELKHIS